MQRYNKLTYIKGKEKEVQNISESGILFYAEDTDKTFLLNGTDIEEITSGGGNAKPIPISDVNGLQNALDEKVNSKTANEPTGSDKVLNIVSLTQAEYDAGTSNTNTIYIITDA